MLDIPPPPPSIAIQFPHQGVTSVATLVTKSGMTSAPSFTPPVAAPGCYPLESAPDLSHDQQALQSGAKLFIHNCLNCHAASAIRYSALLELGFAPEQIKKTLLFSGNLITDRMTVSMTSQDAKKWLGSVPPDLSLITRTTPQTAGFSRIDYIYTYLRSFYRDARQPTGWNNLLSPNGKMPHVLWERQGNRTLTTTVLHPIQMDKNISPAWERITTVCNSQGYTSVTSKKVSHFSGPANFHAEFQAQNPEQAKQFDKDVANLSAFLAWMAAPEAKFSQRFHQKIGIWVVLFLALFLFVAIRLNASYWKHVK